METRRRSITVFFKREFAKQTIAEGMMPFEIVERD
jgi:hypothetical protein